VYSVVKYKVGGGGGGGAWGSRQMGIQVARMVRSANHRLQLLSGIETDSENGGHTIA